MILYEAARAYSRDTESFLDELVSNFEELNAAVMDLQEALNTITVRLNKLERNSILKKQT